MRPLFLASLAASLLVPIGRRSRPVGRPGRVPGRPGRAVQLPGACQVAGAHFHHPLSPLVARQGRRAAACRSQLPVHRRQRIQLQRRGPRLGQHQPGPGAGRDPARIASRPASLGPGLPRRPVDDARWRARRRGRDAPVGQPRRQRVRGANLDHDGGDRDRTSSPSPASSALRPKPRRTAAMRLIFHCSAKSPTRSSSRTSTARKSRQHSVATLQQARKPGRHLFTRRRGDAESPGFRR